MARKTYEIDMINGSVFKIVVSFVIPLILGNILQLLYNAADITVVSRFFGSDAMASVGATGSISNLIISLFIGLTAGAGVVISCHYGAHDGKGVHRAVHTLISFGSACGFRILLIINMIIILLRFYLLIIHKKFNKRLYI